MQQSIKVVIVTNARLPQSHTQGYTYICMFTPILDTNIKPIFVRSQLPAWPSTLMPWSFGLRGCEFNSRTGHGVYLCAS